jgi:ribosomal subunit interface protein
MNISIKATNLSLTSELKEYAEEKIGALERLLPKQSADAVKVDVEIGKPSKHHRKGEVFRCEVNVTMGKILLRAEEPGQTPFESIDRVRDEIEREVKKMKSKRRSTARRAEREVSRRLRQKG